MQGRWARRQARTSSRRAGVSGCVSMASEGVSATGGGAAGASATAGGAKEYPVVLQRLSGAVTVASQVTELSAYALHFTFILDIVSKHIARVAGVERAMYNAMREEFIGLGLSTSSDVVMQAALDAEKLTASAEAAAGYPVVETVAQLTAELTEAEFRAIQPAASSYERLRDSVKAVKHLIDCCMLLAAAATNLAQATRVNPEPRKIRLRRAVQCAVGASKLLKTAQAGFASLRGLPQSWSAVKDVVKSIQKQTRACFRAIVALKRCAEVAMGAPGDCTKRYELGVALLVAKTSNGMLDTSACAFDAIDARQASWLLTSTQQSRAQYQQTIERFGLLGSKKVERVETLALEILKRTTVFSGPPRLPCGVLSGPVERKGAAVVLAHLCKAKQAMTQTMRLGFTVSQLFFETAQGAMSDPRLAAFQGIRVPLKVSKAVKSGIGLAREAANRAKHAEASVSGDCPFQEWAVKLARMAANVTSYMTFVAHATQTSARVSPVPQIPPAAQRLASLKRAISQATESAAKAAKTGATGSPGGSISSSSNSSSSSKAPAPVFAVLRAHLRKPTAERKDTASSNFEQRSPTMSVFGSGRFLPDASIVSKEDKPFFPRFVSLPDPACKDDAKNKVVIWTPKGLPRLTLTMGYPLALVLTCREDKVFLSGEFPVSPSYFISLGIMEYARAPSGLTPALYRIGEKGKWMRKLWRDLTLSSPRPFDGHLPNDYVCLRDWASDVQKRRSETPLYMRPLCYRIFDFCRLLKQMQHGVRCKEVRLLLDPKEGLLLAHVFRLLRSKLRSNEHLFNHVIEYTGIELVSYMAYFGFRDGFFSDKRPLQMVLAYNK